jgi:hypothetical protein
MPSKLIPAISGAETKHFDDMFWKGITEKQLLNKKTVPKTGSIGVFWHLYKDLRPLGASAIAKEKVNKDNPRQPEEGKVMTPVNAKALKAFYEWSQQATEPLFFIKKGTQPLWLCKKVGGYYYEDKPTEPLWYPHRIAFEFVRPANEIESVKRLGVGMNTMILIELTEEQSVSEPPIEMPPKKDTVAKETKAPKAAKAPKAETTEPQPKERKKPGRKPKAKAKDAIETVVEPIPIITNATIKATYVESEEDPLEITATEVVKVQAFEVDGKEYYREPIKNKLYKRLTGGGVGPYIGRWSPRDEKVHEEMPDSDREDDI